MLLVEKGADVNMQLQGGRFGSALAAAAEGGKLEVMKCLLVADADVNQPVQVGRYGNALAAAAYWGRKTCVEALVEAGAEVNRKLENGPFPTALQASQAEVSGEERFMWDERDDECLKREKVEVAELLERHGAT